MLKRLKQISRIFRRVPRADRNRAQGLGGCRIGELGWKGRALVGWNELHALAQGLAGGRDLNRVRARLPVGFRSGPQRSGPASARNQPAISVEDPDVHNERRNPADGKLPLARKDGFLPRQQGRGKLAPGQVPEVAADRG